MAKKKRNLTPMLPGGVSLAGSPEGSIGQAMTVAMLAAAQDGCTCRACRALRTVVDSMFEQYMPGEVEGATGHDNL